MSKLLEKDYLIENMYVHSCATAIIQKTWFNSLCFYWQQLKVENQKKKGGNTVCLEKMLGLLKRFPFLRWGKSYDRSRNCPAASWLEDKSCHKLRNTQFIFCSHTFLLNLFHNQGRDISEYRNQIISSGKCIFMSGSCFPAWGSSASNYSSRLDSKALTPWTCEQHPWKNECLGNKSLCTHLKCHILKVEFLLEFTLNVWVNGYREVVVSVQLYSLF